MHNIRPHVWRRGRRARTVAALATLTLGVAALAVAPADPSTGATTGGTAASALAAGWYIDTDSVTVHEDFNDRGDDPRVAVVAFRTTLGVRSSSRVWTISSFARTCTGVRRGGSCTIPDTVGRVGFGAVSSPSLAQITGGARPEIVGVVHLVGDPTMRPLDRLVSELDEVTAALREHLAATAEQVTAAQLSTVDALTATVVDVLDDPRQLGTIFSEAVGAKVTAMVGVHPSLRDSVNLALLSGLQRRFWIAAAAIERRELSFYHVRPYGNDPTPRAVYSVAQRVHHVTNYTTTVPSTLRPGPPILPTTP